MDIIVLGIFAPLKVSFIAKKELAKIPLFGIFFRTVDIAVDRSSMRDSYQSFTKAKERLDDGYSVIIFPEGTIWEKTPQLKPFKNGAFKLAIEGKYPLIPVTFFNNYKALPDEKFEFYPSILECKVHRPILTDYLNAEDSDKLKDDIYTLIKNDLIEKKVL
jgi:1-acyl-sn-glycerol-3-phosphate acyltransferase